SLLEEAEDDLLAFYSFPAGPGPTRSGDPTTLRSVPIGVGIVDAVAAADGFPFTVTALGAGRQMLRRTHITRLATVRAPVRATRDVASRWDWIRHVPSLVFSLGLPAAGS